ncbi:hypothetical protein [Lysinibacillus varians]|uniref:Uncharacterized protein n=1 Tax=Lysinibacillus varians TaxID=1145276 RepID=A0ABY2TAP8_9BACI|nr:hypothetical protein [Lysinibacillus varians]AHN23914.1 hypothetical protein T479_01550 [Lysinibacillus varians]TKI63041.1 hypothetical protein FC752_12105 [Lysinibacillus varians]
MDFQTEYEILNSLNSDEILEIAFIFNDHQIKVFFAQKEDYEFLTLVCENDQFSFVKNFGIYFENDIAKINGYWGKYYAHAKGLENKENYGFSEFYNKLKQSIQSVNNPNDEFRISYLHNNEGIRRIKNASRSSVSPNDAIYFHYIRRQAITPKQFDKVKDILGIDVAKYLKYSNLNAVFTPDITKQRSFILAPREDND